MIASIIATVAPVLFRVIEQKFGAKTGKTKMDTAIASVKPILEALAAAGKLGGTAPDESALRIILEQVLTAERQKPDWKESGILEAGGKTYNIIILGEVL